MGVTLLYAMWATAQAAEVPALPVRRIRFYETGVGWFERAGSVSDGRARLPLPTAHLDDVLKSLVVLEGDARLDALTYPSAPGTDAARADAGDLSGKTVAIILTGANIDPKLMPAWTAQ